MDYGKIEAFLNEVKPMVEKNSQERAKKAARGEFFNIFSILNVERDEVHTHSAFIAELLNPKGSHGMKDKFLKLFIECMPLNAIENQNDLETNTARTKTEKYLGKKDVANETGGDIDVLVEFLKPRYAIIIENKIDAGDQEAQLARYHNYARQYGQNFTLFYLTKDGHEPSEWSTGSETEKHYWTCISYASNIKDWLLKCIEISDNNLLVRETIKQYINLIDKLTGQELNQYMNEKILAQMLKHNEEMIAIWENLDNWQSAIIENVIKEVAISTNCKCERYDDNYPWSLWNTNCWISFTPKKYINCKIWFGKEANDVPYYYLEKEGVVSAQTKLDCMDYKSAKGTPFGSKYIESKYSKWDICVAQAIQNGEFKNYLIQCINEILADPNFPK